MNDFKNNWSDFIEYFKNNTYKIYTYLYYIYQLLWIVLNVVLIVSGQARGLLMKNKTFNYFDLLIADIIIYVIFIILGTYNLSWQFYITNLIGILTLMFVFPYFNAIHIIVTLILIFIVFNELFNQSKFSSENYYDDQDEDDDYYNDDE